MIGAEGGHVRLDFVGVGAADCLELRAHQLGDDGDLEVGLVDIGQGDDAGAPGVAQPRRHQVAGPACIREQRRDILAMSL